jgi:hypothetical protein
MTAHPHQPESDEADPEKTSSPIGVARDLEAEAEEQGGTTDPDQVDTTAAGPGEEQQQR